jgi:hypothetical protein
VFIVISCAGIPAPIRFSQHHPINKLLLASKKSSGGGECFVVFDNECVSDEAYSGRGRRAQPISPMGKYNAIK